jgi:endonuclease YncB( thermonuclease family)
VLFLVGSPVLAFPDVSGSHPYSSAIEKLASREIISGRLDGSFGPSDPVWRSQFAKMVSGVFALAPAEGDKLAPFADLGPNDKVSLYPHEYVAAVYFAGITKGTTARSFGPYADITRAQVITMVVRGLEQRYPHLLKDPQTGFAGTWGDFSTVHGQNARKAEWNQLLSGLGRTSSTGEGNLGKLDPWGKMSRGEVAQVLANVLTLLDDAVLLQDVDVINVVDGDTLEVMYGGEKETVQLIGIETPPSGDPLAAQAKAALEQRLIGGEVGLELDAQQRDPQGCMLAYVWYAEGQDYLMANWDLLLLGLATATPDSSNKLYERDFQQSEDYARQMRFGTWAGR